MTPDPAVARAWLARYGRARDGWLSDAVARLRSDPDIATLLSVGSLGRGGGDDLSDIDLVVVPEPRALAGMVADPVSRFPFPGPVLARRDVPRNGPAGGTYAGVSVEVADLPMWVDLYVWPAGTAAVPADGLVLIEGVPAPPLSASGFVELVTAHADPSAPEVPDDDVAVVMRVCVAGKYLARGDWAALARVARGWSLPLDDPATTAAELRNLVAAGVPERLRHLTLDWLAVCEAVSGNPHDA